MPVSLLTPFFLIVSGITTGMILRRIGERMGRGDSVPRIRRRLQWALLTMFNPICFTLALWVLDVSDPSLFARLPLIGLAALVIGYGWGMLGARLMRLGPLQAGVWRSSASLTNIGNIGGIVVFSLIGEAGFALIPFYKLSEELWYYGVVFPAARRDGERYHGSTDPAHPLTFLKDPFLLTSLAAIVIGMSLNLSGLERPALAGPVNAVLIPLTTFGFLLSIGLSLHLTRIRPHIGMAMALAAVKFVLTPVVVCLLALALGITPANSPVLFATILILSAMPTAFVSLVPPSLYRLDLDLANACWLVTTSLLVLMVPLLWVVIHAIT
jgi:predicted permease